MPVNLYRYKFISFIQKLFYLKGLYVLIFLCSCLQFKTGFAQTQTIDSLKKVLPSLHDSARINCLNELGFEYSNPHWNKSHYVQTDTALFYTAQAQSQAQTLHYIRGLGKSLQNFGMVEEQRGNYIKSERYTRLAIPSLEKTGMQSEYHRAIVNLAWCALYQGRYDETLQDCKTVLPYYQHIEDVTHIAMIYRMIGNTYIHKGYFDSAFYFFQKDRQIKKTNDDIIGVIRTPQFMGYLYLTAGDTTKAVFFYLQSVDSAKAKNAMTNPDYPSMFLIYKLKHNYDSALWYFQQYIRSTQLAGTDSFLKNKALMLEYKDIAELCLLKNDYTQAIAFCRKPLKAFKEGGNLTDFMTILKYMAIAYHGKHDRVKSLYYAHQLLAYAKRDNARPWVRDAYKILWNIYDKKNELSSAYQYHLKYTTLNDSIESNNYKAKIAAWDAITKMTEEDEDYKAQLKITEEKNNAKIALVNKEKQLQLYVFVSAFLIVLLSIVIFVRYTKLKSRKEQLQLQMTEAKAELEKRKQEQEVTELQRQKTELELQALRAQMNPHFIFNCLNSINRFIIANNTPKAADYLTKFAKLIRIVLQQSGKSFIPLEDELYCLQLYMDLEALRFETPFSYEINCDGINISSVMIPSLLIQPFVENGMGCIPRITAEGSALI